MLHFILTGTLLGLSAGFAPGPLLTLVISETLKHNTRAGIKVALAPVITDLPIIAVCIFILAKLSHLNSILAVISLMGGMVVMVMGLQSLKIKGCALELSETKERAFFKGIAVNALSPYPYLFWLSVGSPIMFKAFDRGLLAAVAFVGVFYLCLVGAKLFLAILTGRSSNFLSGRAYLVTIKILGLLLVVFSFYLFREGWLLFSR